MGVENYEGCKFSGSFRSKLPLVETGGFVLRTKAVKQRKHESADVSFCEPMRSTGFSKQTIIESFPEEQRESLIEIVKCRLVEERRNQLAQDIIEAREEFRRGEIKRGTVDDLMCEIPE